MKVRCQDHVLRIRGSCVAGNLTTKRRHARTSAAPGLIVPLERDRDVVKRRSRSSFTLRYWPRAEPKGEGTEPVRSERRLVSASARSRASLVRASTSAVSTVAPHQIRKTRRRVAIGADVVGDALPCELATIAFGDLGDRLRALGDDGVEDRQASRRC